jgi:hypothetical protein
MFFKHLQCIEKTDLQAKKNKTNKTKKAAIFRKRPLAETRIELYLQRC